MWQLSQGFEAKGFVLRKKRESSFQISRDSKDIYSVMRCTHRFNSSWTNMRGDRAQFFLQDRGGAGGFSPAGCVSWNQWLELVVKLVGWNGLDGRVKVAMARLTALLLLPVLIESVFSISFNLPVNSRKCLREEIHKDVLVTGEYDIGEQANTKTNLKVSRDPQLATVNVAVNRFVFEAKVPLVSWHLSCCVLVFSRDVWCWMFCGLLVDYGRENCCY